MNTNNFFDKLKNFFTPKNWNPITCEETIGAPTHWSFVDLHGNPDLINNLSLDKATSSVEDVPVFDQMKRVNKYLRDQNTHLSLAYDELKRKHETLCQQYHNGETNYNLLVERYKDLENFTNQLRNENVNLKNLYSKTLNEKIAVQERLSGLYAEICEKENSGEDVSET